MVFCTQQPLPARGYQIHMGDRGLFYENDGFGWACIPFCFDLTRRILCPFYGLGAASLILTPDTWCQLSIAVLTLLLDLDSVSVITSPHLRGRLPRRHLDSHGRDTRRLQQDGSLGPTCLTRVVLPDTMAFSTTIACIMSIVHEYKRPSWAEACEYQSLHHSARLPFQHTTSQRSAPVARTHLYSYSTSTTRFTSISAPFHNACSDARSKYFSRPYWR